MEEVGIPALERLPLMGITPDIRRSCEKRGYLGVWYQDCVLQGGSLAGGERRAVAVLELVKCVGGFFTLWYIHRHDLSVKKDGLGWKG